MKNTFSKKRFTCICLTCFISIMARNSSFSQNVEKEQIRQISKEESILVVKAEELARNDIKRAISTLRSARNDNSSTIFLFKLSELLLQGSQKEAAIKILKQIISADSTFYQARENLISLYLEKDQFAQVVKHISIIMDTRVENKQKYRKIIAFCLYELGEISGANLAYKQALMVEPGDKQLTNGLIQTSLALEDYVTAKAVATKALETDPLNRNLWMMLSDFCLQNENHSEALQWLEGARRIGVLTQHDLFTLAQIYMYENMKDNATDIFLKIGSTENSKPNLILDSSEILIQAGKVDAAETILNKLKGNHKLPPKDIVKVNYLAASILHANGEIQQAVDKYEKVLKSAPLHADTLMKLAKIYFNNKSYPQAMVCYKRLEYLPKHKHLSQIRQSVIAVENNDYSKALNLLDEVMTNDPSTEIKRYYQQIKHINEQEMRNEK